MEIPETLFPFQHNYWRMNKYNPLVFLRNLLVLDYDANIPASTLKILVNK